MALEFQGVSSHVRSIMTTRNGVSVCSEEAGACRTILSMSSGLYSGLAIYARVCSLVEVGVYYGPTFVVLLKDRAVCHSGCHREGEGAAEKFRDSKERVLQCNMECLGDCPMVGQF